MFSFGICPGDIYLQDSQRPIQNCVWFLQARLCPSLPRESICSQMCYCSEWVATHKLQYFFLLVTTDLQHTLWLWVPHSCSGICWDTTAWESFFIFPQIGAQSSSISSVMIVQPIVQQSLTSVLPSIENENFLISPEFICSVKDVCQLWKEYLQSHTRCNWDKLLGFWGPLEERPVEQKRDEHFLNLR